MILRNSFQNFHCWSLCLCSNPSVAIALTLWLYRSVSQSFRSLCLDAAVVGESVRLACIPSPPLLQATGNRNRSIPAQSLPSFVWGAGPRGMDPLCSFLISVSEWYDHCGHTSSSDTGRVICNASIGRCHARQAVEIDNLATVVGKFMGNLNLSVSSL